MLNKLFDSDSFFLDVYPAVDKGQRMFNDLLGRLETEVGNLWGAPHLLLLAGQEKQNDDRLPLGTQFD